MSSPNQPGDLVTETVEDIPEESQDTPSEPKQTKKRKETAQVSTRDPGKSLLPFSRVQKILKADKELPIVAKEAAFLISLATEEFIKQLAEEICISAQRESRVTVQYRDVASIVRKSDKFMFLDEIVPWQNPDVPAKRKAAAHKDKAGSSRPTTLLDNFVQKNVDDDDEAPEELDEDVVMNEDGTMTAG
ncbi:hypothetical protein QCA50_010207 [Cerrena zonata]|uniref:Transcription factor CBF/NF-Y/archaeal histone domain-containing protein n=1 Tax=Cerrena zonata TaxID=2478898 RepID=A0AAW0G9N2_9APHY